MLHAFALISTYCAVSSQNLDDLHKSTSPSFFACVQGILDLRLATLHVQHMSYLAAWGSCSMMQLSAINCIMYMDSVATGTGWGIHSVCRFQLQLSTVNLINTRSGFLQAVCI